VTDFERLLAALVEGGVEFIVMAMGCEPSRTRYGWIRTTG